MLLKSGLCSADFLAKFGQVFADLVKRKEIPDLVPLSLFLRHIDRLSTASGRIYISELIVSRNESVKFFNANCYVLIPFSLKQICL